MDESETRLNRWEQRYLVYRDLGPARRLLAAYRQSGGRSVEVPAVWLDTFERHSWRQRAEDYDREQTAIAAIERDRDTAKERTERVILLKAARSKIIADLQTSDAHSDGFGALVSHITALTSQLRAESEH